MTDAPKQQQFDFHRSDQLGLIDDAHIESQAVGNDRVRGTHIRHVLRVIDSHGRGKEAYPSIATIARETSLSVRTVKRAIAALVSLSLITVTKRCPRGGSAPVNHYRIVWSELALLVRRNDQAEEAWCQSDTNHGANLSRPWGQSGTMHGASESDHGASLSKHGASLSRPWGQSGTQTANEAPITSSPPMTAVEPAIQEEEKWEGDDCHSPTASADLVSEYAGENVFDAERLVEKVLPIVGPRYLTELLTYWRANKHDWRGSGALRERLIRSNLNLDIAEGWPPRTPKPAVPIKRISDEERAAQRAELERQRIEARKLAATESLSDQFRRLRDQAGGAT